MKFRTKVCCSNRSVNSVLTLSDVHALRRFQAFLFQPFVAMAAPRLNSAAADMKYDRKGPGDALPGPIQPTKAMKFKSRVTSGLNYPLAGQFRDEGEVRDAIFQWKYAARGVFVQKLHVGRQTYIANAPQQLMPFARSNLTVAPDSQERTTIVKNGKNDDVPFLQQSSGHSLSIRPWAVVFVTRRMQALAAGRNVHDARAIVTMSPAGIPASELATMVPVGIMTGGAPHNAFAPEAKQQNIILPLSHTGLLVTTNMSETQMPAGTAFAMVLPRACVADDAEMALAEVGRAVPKPKFVHGTRPETASFELVQAPVARDIPERLNSFDRDNMQHMIAGFNVSPMDPKAKADAITFEPKTYDPITCFHFLRAAICTPTDAVHIPLQGSEGVDAFFAIRLLSAAVAIQDLIQVGSTWTQDANALVNKAGRGKISLRAFVHGEAGKDGATSDGVLAMLKTAIDANKGKVEAVAWNSPATTNEIQNRVCGGASAFSRLMVLALGQMNEQAQNSIFGITVRSTLPGGDMTYLRV